MPTTQIILRVGGVGTGSRVHENAEVVLRQNDVAIHGFRMANDGLFGIFQFFVEDAIGASFEARVVFHSPFVRDARGQPTTELLVPFDLAEIRQQFTLSRAGQPTAQPRLHPRVQFPPSLGTASSAIVQVHFATAVLDVTALYLASSRDRVARDLFHDVDAHVEVVDGKPRFKTASFAGCTPRLTAHAAGEVIWMVVPPCIDGTTTRASVVRMLPDRDEPYRDLFDVSLLGTMRYLGSFSDADRLRTPGSPRVPTLERSDHIGFSRPSRRQEHHVPAREAELDAQTFGNTAIDFPMLRLCEQLANSGKKAILTLPVPMGAFLAAERENISASLRMGLATVSLRLLQSHGLVGQADGDLVSLDKLVLAAHGASGQYGIHEFDDNRDDYDELWLFDPDHLDRSWHRLDHATNARIRLIGGDSHPFLLTKMAALGDTPPAENVHTIPTSVGNVTVWPRTAGFFARSKSYNAAHQPYRWSADDGRIVETDWTPTRLQVSDVEAQRRGGYRTSPFVLPDEISDLVGVVEVITAGDEQPSEISVACVLDNGAWTHATTITGVAMNEIVVGLVIGLGRRKASSERQVRRALEEVEAGASIRRREWSLLGWQALSDGNDENAADYKSYFELCLHFSGIEQGTAATPNSPSGEDDPATNDGADNTSTV